MQHDYKEGTNISPHIHWSPSSTASGNVKWQMTYSWVNKTGAFGSGTTASKTVAATGTVGSHIYTTFAPIAGSGKEIGSIIALRLFRDSGDGSDTYEDDAIFLDFGIHYQCDSIGSREAGSK